MTKETIDTLLRLRDLIAEERNLLLKSEANAMYVRGAEETLAWVRRTIDGMIENREESFQEEAEEEESFQEEAEEEESFQEEAEEEESFQEAES